MKTGLESLDTGAPEITYSGNEGPKSPQQMQQMQQMQMAQLEEEYDAYVDDMIEQGIEPMSMRQFLEQIAAEAQMSSNEEGIGSMMEDPREMAADGGIMGSNAGSMLVTPTRDGSRPGYYGPDEGHANDPGHGSNAPGGGNDARDDDGTRYDMVNMISNPDARRALADPRNTLQQGINNARAQGERQRELARQREIDTAKEKERIREMKETKKTKEFFKKKETKKTKQSVGDKLRSMALAKSLNKKYGLDFDPTDPKFEEKVARATETVNDPNFDMGLFGISGQNLARGAKQAEVFGTEGRPNYNISQTDFENVYRPYDQMFVDGIFRPASPRGGEKVANDSGGLRPITNTQLNTQPNVNPYDDISTDFVDLSGTSSYTNPAFAGQYFYGKPTITLANGGRANYAGGGIADLRQGYFLGKLVKKITKPFKKAFKGFKKIAKSPMGKMALLALGGYYLGGGTGLGGARMFGNTGFSMQNLPGASFFSKKPVLSPNAIGGDKVIPKLMSSNNLKPALDGGNFLTKTLGYMKDNPLATIMATSGLSGAYTAYLNNKRQDETMEEYNRRLEIERGNFGDIPVGPVQFAANGGRMGFADGGDDEDDDNFRQRALGALYSIKRPRFSIGGGAGMPPVTMMSEGQDVQSFGDDESTGMANATPTMPNQMPMRPPMMDPRMQQQMMMQQRMNPMMNRGMMSMQQPRIMAQEGGMMDMGGMEKDYRNEGGFVPIGEYERKDDVPARLSKNEFVFTADAVRNAGGGDIDKGAEIMENMMENLENGGQVSQESQGLSGAREMFATSQRLEEVL
jgi:hypothetical protein